MKKIILSVLLIFCMLLTACGNAAEENESKTETSAGTVASENCTVHFIDCGKADAILILSDGEAMLIDAGYEETSDMVISYLKQQGVTELKYVVLTHGDKDHVGGMAAVLSAFTVDQLYVNPRSEKSDWYSNMVRVVEEKEIPTSIPAVGDTFTLGKGTFTVEAPGEKALAEDKDNDASLVLYYVYGNRSFLFMGDAGETTEKEMRNNDLTHICDVLKVGHHGKDDATTKKFLKAVAPLYAVITCGEIQGDDESGEPDQSVLNLLSDFNVKTYRTDESGIICFTTDGTELSVSTEK